jgi:Protein NO VEIN, C-terminal
MSKLALKRLTASDLTFFEWQFQHRNAGNQKAINLNADVFISVLFPALPSLGNDRLPIDLYLYGPAGKAELNLQRKIIKGGNYKNWRLNGETVHNPDDDPSRFDVLVEGDIAVFEFDEGVFPTQARCVLLAAAIAEDAPLHARLAPLLRTKSMVPIDERTLETLVTEAGLPAEHSVHALLLDADLEDAAQGGLEGTRHLRRRRATRRIQRGDLLEAKRRAEENGQRGEELVNAHFQQRLDAGEFKSFVWEAAENAIAPYDFRVEHHDGTSECIDVKSTAYDFSRPIHISLAELEEMGEKSRYSLYRVYDLGETSASLRVAVSLNAFAKSVTEALSKLPHGVVADGVALHPETIGFSKSIRISIPD